jgi:hypothetical protein
MNPAARSMTSASNATGSWVVGIVVTLECVPDRSRPRQSPMRNLM